MWTSLRVRVVALVAGVVAVALGTAYLFADRGAEQFIAGVAVSAAERDQQMAASLLGPALQRAAQRWAEPPTRSSSVHHRANLPGPVPLQEPLRARILEGAAGSSRWNRPAMLAPWPPLHLMLPKDGHRFVGFGTGRDIVCIRARTPLSLVELARRLCRFVEARRFYGHGDRHCPRSRCRNRLRCRNRGGQFHWYSRRCRRMRGADRSRSQALLWMSLSTQCHSEHRHEHQSHDPRRDKRPQCMSTHRCHRYRDR